MQRAFQVSPRAAVVEAYRELESGAISKLLSLGGPECETLSSKGIRTLEDLPGLDRGTVSLLRDLRGLRNEVAHAPKFALSARRVPGRLDRTMTAGFRAGSSRRGA